MLENARRLGRAYSVDWIGPAIQRAPLIGDKFTYYSISRALSLEHQLRIRHSGHPNTKQITPICVRPAIHHFMFQVRQHPPPANHCGASGPLLNIRAPQNFPRVYRVAVFHPCFRQQRAVPSVDLEPIWIFNGRAMFRVNSPVVVNCTFRRTFRRNADSFVGKNPAAGLAQQP